MTVDNSNAIEAVEVFKRDSLTNVIAELEAVASGLSLSNTQSFLADAGISEQTLRSAVRLKHVSAQIDVVIHSVGILSALPHILEENEVVEYVSLGAGNTGRRFDLETTHQIAEFKFIHWKGGAESIRQNGVFKDLFNLASAETAKKRVLYVIDDKYPLKFLTGNRALRSVMSKDRKTAESFESLYGDRFERVSQYYEVIKDLVQIVALNRVLPTLHFSQNDS